MHLISVTTNRDLLVPVAAGTAGFDLPEVVDSIPLHHLRYVDGGVVDASSITRFFIDEGGQKHVVHVDGWEQLDCGIDDQLTRTKAGWRVWTEEDQEVLVDTLRDRALDMLPTWEKSERAAGIEHAGQRWLTTSAALQDIRDVLLAGAVPGEQWVTADRQIVPMTLPELQSLWQAITARGAAIYQRRLEMEQQIADMSREQLEAFVPGWPVSLQEAVA